MSGFGNNTQVTYLSAMNGKIVRRVNKDFEGAIERQKTKGDKGIVHEVLYDNVTGFVTGIKIKDTDFGKMWVVGLSVEGEPGETLNCELSLGYKSNAANCFLCCIENVDVKEPLTLIAREQEYEVGNEIVKSTGLILKQHGEMIKWAHTKKTPNGMPEKKKVIFDGKEQWDSTDRLAFFENLINEKILPKLGKTETVESPVEPESEDSSPF